MHESDFHWLVGIIEGEGTFLVSADSPRRSAALRVNMTDADIVQRVASLFGRAVVPLKGREEHHKNPFVTTIKGAPAVQLMTDVRGFVSRKRQGQIQRVLTGWRPERQPRQRWAREPIHIDGSRCNDECETAWLAGLLEGEGTFGIQHSDDNSYPVVQVEMSDQEVVRRAAGLLGAPSVRRVAPRRSRWSETYVAAITGEAAAGWMQTLRPLMGERRSDAIDLALAAYRPIRLTSAPDFCIVSGCRAPHRSRGLCHAHYMSWWRDVARGRKPRVIGLR